ncbi:hypothetical protein [Actinopolyspora mortivallis]|uniref:DUF885 domain-containing protein n=1 Tax=Actinopolyspora mortivallis TaxID=33906 RepID=A0A2T0H0L9_ACTMO|nr:hypothetical protein [Actinopolyspora mortivallis]PRW64905.1 hypothetical protein CEP50_03595 [Actinopolyspora mortivallis]
MDERTTVTEYLRLGVRFGRLAPRLLHGYTGDGRLLSEVYSEPPPAPRELAAQARRLRGLVRSGDLPARRGEFLLGQLTALDCLGRMLAGARPSFGARLRACFQLDAVVGEPEPYERAHAELDTILPGTGPLSRRMAAFRERDRVPPRVLPACVRALSTALRERTSEVLGLPGGESVDYRFVTDPRVSGLHHYLGHGRSRVSVGLAAPHRTASLPRLIAHESYPGHHVQYCRRRSPCRAPEQAVVLAQTPECVVAEGLAERGLDTVVGPGWGEWARRVLSGVLRFPHAELAERVDRALRKLSGVRGDAAVMLHEHGCSRERVCAYLRHWLLLDETRATALVDLLSDPTPAAHAVVCSEGERLMVSRTAQDEVVGTARDYLRLLEEPHVPRTVRAALVAPTGDHTVE